VLASQTHLCGHNIFIKIKPVIFPCLPSQTFAVSPGRVHISCSYLFFLSLFPRIDAQPYRTFLQSRKWSGNSFFTGGIAEVIRTYLSEKAGLIAPADQVKRF